MRPFIPNTSPWITEREVTAVSQALREGRLASSGENLQAARDVLRQLTQGREVLLTTSCTAALELAFLSLDLPPGSEVLLPSFTFVSTATAVLRAQAKPVFVEIEGETFNLDLLDLEQRVTAKTQALLPVHYNGCSCAMERLLTLAQEHHLAVVEDAAHAVGALYRGRPLGTFGDFGCFSFHDTKNETCGEGGALVLNNPVLRQRAEWAYEKGTNRAAFLRGEVDKYTWVSPGGSFALSGLLAALLKVQLERHEELQAARQRIVARYREGLAPLEEAGWIRFQRIPEGSTPSEHLAVFLVEDPLQRDPLLAHLKRQGIGAVFHYIPLHLSSFARRHFGTRPGQFPVTERVAASIVRLPLYPHLPLEDCDFVIEQVLAFFGKRRQVLSSVERPEGSQPFDSAQGKEAIDFTLVLPCYNEAPHLHGSLAEIRSVLDRMGLTYELLLIDDASTDGTPLRIEEYRAKHPQCPLRAVFHSRNQGRGATVTEGIRLARGRFVGFLDVDLEVHARYLPAALLPLQRGEADMVLGERSYKFAWSALERMVLHKGYRWLVRRMLRTPPLDTEAGFKFFRRSAILPVLARVQDPHWFWDTEVTVLAFDGGLRIEQLPVLFVRREEKHSTFRAMRDSVQSFLSLLRFWRWRVSSRRMEGLRQSPRARGTPGSRPAQGPPVRRGAAHQHPVSV